jgi:preprotein translocase subunit SecD
LEERAQENFDEEFPAASRGATPVPDRNCTRRPHISEELRMSKNLRWKWLFIMATVAACILVVTGLPTSRQQLLENLERNIRLGLDLKGGSHLVLQVQVQDAFKTEADQFIEQLKDQLQKETVTYASIDRNENQPKRSLSRSEACRPIARETSLES